MYQTEPKDAKHHDCADCGDPLPARHGASTLLCERCQRTYTPREDYGSYSIVPKPGRRGLARTIALTDKGRAACDAFADDDDGARDASSKEGAA